jgi:phosphoglycerol transferase MdoB-like AlkP superfamily enzyme
MILKPYYYLFYRIYKRQRTQFGEFESISAAAMVLSSLVFLNLFTIETLMEKLNVLPLYSLPVILIIIIFLILMFLNTLFFYSKQRYKKIEALFESNKKIPFGLGWILIYVALSFIVFFYVVNFR